MSLQRNHYEVIGVPPTATTDEIKKKYRELARQFHPDVVKDKDLGQRIFTQINQAYRVLADPERRTQYDTTLLADKVRNGSKSAATTVAAASAAVSASPPAAAQPLSAQAMANVMRLLSDAEAAMMQNKLGSVKMICDKVLEVDPRNTKALSILGDALVQMGKPRDAAAAYRRALQVAPSALIQSKLSRLEGMATATNGAGMNGTVNRPASPLPPAGTNGAGAASNRTNQNRTDQGRVDKPVGGLLGRLLGRK